MKTKHLIPALFALLLTGCSTFGFVFSQLPFFIAWQMDRMFDLNSKQSEMVKQATREFQDWLRVEGIPLWIERLSTARSTWVQGEHEAAALYFEQSVHTSVNELLQTLRPKVLPIILTLNEKNAKHYRKFNQKKQDDWFEYALSDEHKQDKRIDKLYEWFGPLRDSQSREARAIVKLFPNERTIRYANNEHWMNLFLDNALERNADELNRWLSEPSIWWLPEYAQLRELNQQQNAELVRMMISSMSTKQSLRVASFVEEWVERLEDVLD